MTDTPVLLDPFCGAGGAAMGYSRAGFGSDSTTQLGATMPDWANRECKDMPTEVFFTRETFPQARAACRWCNVRVECRERNDAVEPVDPNHMFGVFGGETPNERFMRRNAVSRVA